MQELEVTQFSLRHNGTVADLVLNRSTAANALSTNLLESLAARLESLSRMEAVRVVVLSAAGRVFCSGMDLKEAGAASPAEVRAIAERLVGVTSKLRQFERPVIAKVRGMASAAGLELMLACDLAYAARSARFATPGVNVGMWCMTPMVPLVRTVPLRHATELLMRGDPIDVDHAERIGLINGSFEDSELDLHVDRIAFELAAKSPYTLALGKRALREQAGLSLPDAYSRAIAYVETNAAHPDGTEGTRAFVQKRAPRWSPPG